MGQSFIPILGFSLLLILLMFAIFYIGNRIGASKEKREQELAKQSAADLIENANQVIEGNKRVAILETKEKINKIEREQQMKETEMKDRLDKQSNELQILGKELSFKESALHEKQAELQTKQEELSQFGEKVLEEKNKLDETKIAFEEEKERALYEVSKLTEAEAKDIVMKKTYKKIDKAIAKQIRSEEEKMRFQLKQKGKAVLVSAMQKYAADVATERTSSVVTLTNDDMKGRLIGREGRNIRSIEMLTGVDVIIDDTPEAVALSSFDPIRRELARMTVQELVDDGRIHPGRIEEVFAKKQEELHSLLVEMGEATLVEMNLPEMDEQALELFGKLHFRTSYGQNILQHSKEVGYLAGVLAEELGEDVTLARRAGLFHDIGKAIDFETEGTHVELGVKVAKKLGENSTVINAIASHHGDTEATTIISELVAIADTLSATRPGARKESLESYIKRLQDLEELSTNFDGVEKAYAIQAGREIRVIVNPDKVSDKDTVLLAFEIKEQIEEKLQYPGTIKVTVLRETRAVDVAK